MYYTNDASLELCHFELPPGPGYTPLPSMPVGGIVAVATWWRDRDLEGQISSDFHPSIPVDGEPDG